MASTQLTFSQLRTFVAVAQTGSVRAAADELFVTPSAVSTALTALQERLGVALVEREGRGLRLTKAGVIYTDYARRILGLLQEGQAAAAGETDPEGSELRLAAVTTAGEQLLPRLLAAFTQRYPRVGLHLEVGNREHVWSLLDTHQAHLVIGGRPNPVAALQVHAVRRNDLVVVAGHPPPEDGDVVVWLAAQTWLLREHGSGTHATTTAYLERLEIRPHTLTLGSNVAIVEAVAAGLGVTLVSHDAIAGPLEEGVLWVVGAPGTPMRRDWHLVSHCSPLPAAARLLVNFVLEHGDFEPAPSPGRQADNRRAEAGAQAKKRAAGLARVTARP